VLAKEPSTELKGIMLKVGEIHFGSKVNSLIGRKKSVPQDVPNPSLINSNNTQTALFATIHSSQASNSNLQSLP
jgi:hypothetical protein